MKFLLGTVILALIWIPSITQARIGDTLAECEQRYGSSSAPGSKVLPSSFRADVGSIHVFYPEGWEIWTCILDGVCVLQVYQKQLKGEIRFPLHEDEVPIITKAESGGQKWKYSGTFSGSTKDSKTGNTLTWETVRYLRPDGVSLMLTNNRSYISVSSPRWHTASQEAYAKADVNRLKKLEKF
ncbi:MAG: hypothetical protein ABL974_13455 [Prosthecobacter sp.]